MKQTIVIIPARGGSKGIPRKNLRPLAGKPLIYYAIQAAKNSKFVSKVIVSTEDDEIALISERLGAEVLMRPEHLSDDTIPLDPVILNVVNAAEEKWNITFDFVVTVQPTSPLVRTSDIDTALNILINSGSDTLISVVKDKHLRWTSEGGKLVPLYKKRVNRQELPDCFRETGAVIGCTRDQLRTGTRIGNSIELLEMDKNRSFDIDSFSDFYLCESILSRKRIVFTVVGYSEVGMGHVYRSTLIANELVNYEIIFICEKKSKLASEFIKAKNYTVIECDNGDLLGTIMSLQPNMVINDILDTNEEFILNLKNKNIKVINFEDMGLGSLYADLVVNALYPHQIASKNLLTGAAYFCLRDEFMFSPEKKLEKRVKRILLTFGGVDEGNVTCRVADLLADLCIANGIELDIVSGPGFKFEFELTQILQRHKSLKAYFSKGIARISDNMLLADIAITSGGRTVFELASLKVPTIVICQNERETTHSFASFENGIINLGLHKELSNQIILSEIERVISDYNLRFEMYSIMGRIDLKLGRGRIVDIIKSLIT